ncbi:thermostable hemolysin [Marinobacterium aestuariivivens]|uniref:Thermostable hemolysin n=1 Tax=Marinobacterium aestuariivivens TaxID=1698799 RepID=A0ABW2A205_9GAMM
MQVMTAPHLLSLVRCPEGSATFERVKRYACTRYADVHQARLRHFLPLQILLGDERHWLASCGLRSADSHSLFLEQYLDRPVERALGSVTGNSLGRRQIVEVGNLAGEPGSARLMILSLTRYLAQSGVDFVVFTATRELQHAFSRLGLATWFLAQASPERLGDEAADWGRYYSHAPAVFAGSVALGWLAIQQQPLLMRMLRSVEPGVADAV